MVNSTAYTARFNHYETGSAGDVVLVKQPGNAFIAAEVWLHLDVAGQLVSVLSCWAFRSLHEAHRPADWAKTQNALVISTPAILTAVVWIDLGNNTVRTFFPSKLVCFRSEKCSSILIA